jgi:prepilin-type N-terminal cleavage/methylation domain-containing protein
MAPSQRKSAAFTLIEVLLVVALMAVLAGLVLPNSDPSIHDQLHSAARILAGDLAYARSLAVTYGNTCRVTFDVDGNQYVLHHAGVDTPFRNPDDPAGQYVVRLADWPHLGRTVRLVAATASDAAAEPVGDLVFGPLGGTARSGATVLWLSAGEGSAKRYVSLRVNPVTGLTTIGSSSGAGTL